MFYGIDVCRKIVLMKIHKMTFIITLVVAMVLILISAVILRTRPASDAGPVPTPSFANASTIPPLGNDVDLFTQNLNLEQPDNEISCQGCDLTRASLVEAYLEMANLSGASLWQADLEGAHLATADLTGADLEGAVLKDANLSGADLSGAKLYSANLRGADLSGSNLIGADFFDANLDGVIGADFNGALNVPSKYLGGGDMFEFVEPGSKGR